MFTKHIADLIAAYTFVSHNTFILSFFKTQFMKVLTTLFVFCALLGLTAASSHFIEKKDDFYNDFNQAIETCGPCIEESNIHKMNDLQTALVAIKANMAKQKESFDLQLLSLRIEYVQTSIKIELYAIDQLQYPTLSEQIIALQRRREAIGEKSTVFSTFVKVKWKSHQLSAFQMNDASLQQFDDVLWAWRTTGIDNLVKRAEDIVFNKMAPNQTACELEYFISKTMYTNSWFNHHAQEAFILYYKILTLSGDRKDLDLFDTYFIEKLKRSASPWKQLFTDTSFRRNYYEPDRILARNFESILEEQDPAVLRAFIQKAAPRETAFLVVQKLVEQYKSNNDWTSVFELLGETAPLFEENHKIQYMKDKFLQYKDNLYNERKQNKNKEYTINPVQGLANPEENELHFFLNTNKKSLALQPASTGMLKVYKMNGNLEVQQEDKVQITMPETFIYWFEEKDKTKLNVVNPIERNNIFPSSPPFNTIRSYDFYIHSEVIFFVSSDTKERMLPLDEKSNRREYNSPGFVQNDLSFQEFGKISAYHGRRKGNTNTDIYYMVRDKNGNWSSPHLLLLVNTPFCERSPVYDPNEGCLYFSSEGHAGPGGFDVYTVPVAIDRGSTTVSVTGEVKPLKHLNTGSDELFYTPVDNVTAYFSSNQNGTGDFDIFCITKSTKKKIDKLNEENRSGDDSKPGGDLKKERINPAAPTRTPRFFNRYKAPVDFSVNCIWDSLEQVNRGADYMGGRIMVTGQVFDEQGHLYPKAKIVFQQQGTQEKYQAKIDLAQGDAYQVYLMAGQKYVVRVYGYSAQGDTLCGFIDEFTEICPANESLSNTSIKDFKLTEINKILESGHTLKVPFFFDFNESAYTVSNEGAIIGQMEDFIQQFSNVKGAKIILIACADTIGSLDQCQLVAKRRGESSYEFLSIRKLNKIPLKIEVIGKTDRFNDRASLGEGVGTIIPVHVWKKLKTTDEKQRFMNRRVEIIIIGVGQNIPR
jgi:hypothetical protein